MSPASQDDLAPDRSTTSVTATSSEDVTDDGDYFDDMSCSGSEDYFSPCWESDIGGSPPSPSDPPFVPVAKRPLEDRVDFFVDQFIWTGAPAGAGPQLQGLLSQFDDKIRSIVRAQMPKPHDSLCLKRIIAEELYNQATTEGGMLYLPSSHSSQQQRWNNFWYSVLNGSYNGPTLFRPQLHDGIEEFTFDTTDQPPYLFRTFDIASAGLNCDEEIGSIMSCKSWWESERDILSLDKYLITNRVFKHLTGSKTGWKRPNNLISWTSSLLYAIQSAIFRHSSKGWETTDIEVCAVDTRKFPRGQFMRDIWFIQTYRGIAARIGGRTWGHFRCLNLEKYRNGEYLAQGKLKIAGRSCLVSLAQLERSGLYDLFPEFQDPEGAQSTKWRVRELRREWKDEQDTSNEAIRAALKISKECFPNFEAVDMALMLLTFRALKYQEALTTEAAEQKRLEDARHPKWGHEPDEVRRYMTAARLLKPRIQQLESQDLADHRTDLIEGLFECS
ncbi:hypothetical protein F4777DRAFT_516765 [Nemania sp. FL0916]|nr:hypothetical protein F4777DRAFT_516765 [Nemania sp. FL0916]